MTKFYLLFVFLLAIFFRFNNLNWDHDFHLHPDERFLTMVGNAMRIPANIVDYLNPQVSTLNPGNVGFKFFVYGVFPLSLNKILAVIFNNDNYNAFTIQGRFLSAFFDLLTVILVYKTAKLLINKKTNNYELLTMNFPLLTAFFYAIAVLPIQLSHFFAVDTFLNFFMFASFYFALRGRNVSRSLPAGRQGTFHVSIFLSAVFFGLALASKITALFILPLNLFFILKSQLQNGRLKVVMIILYFCLAYISLRTANPYYFENSNFFDPHPSKLFVSNLKELKGFESPDIWYPPGVQWIHKPAVIFSLYNLAFFGVGIPYFILVLLGMTTVISNIKDQISKIKNKKLLTINYELLTIMFWVILFFLYQSTRHVKSIRYFIFLCPFLAIFAGIGLKKIFNFQFSIFKSKVLSSTFHVLSIGLLLIWPLAFSSIYLTKNSRVAASEWIYKNLPNGSFILSEHWDDGLPLFVEQTYGKLFSGEQLPVFDPDTPEKWQRMNYLLKNADYYILSSNRGWGSIPTAPEKYPKMSKFYNDLFAEKLRYKKVKEFVSYPKFSIFNFQFSIPDHWADESFTVYDHPKVIIYQNVTNE